MCGGQKDETEKEYLLPSLQIVDSKWMHVVLKDSIYNGIFYQLIYSLMIALVDLAAQCLLGLVCATTQRREWKPVKPPELEIESQLFISSLFPIMRFFYVHNCTMLAAFQIPWRLAIQSLLRQKMAAH